ncbi:hypothetical protein VTN77DRAFT_2510 [Rasamsonia byssochlamydoides]|uniref:uncharacterized protein n=1 Tax=Rasamsonia byssochlamydoides TaxID=89139 RepID=UPI00374244B9
MQISQLYVYPIKSLRPTKLQEALVTRHGFPYDRCFMLLKIEKDDKNGRTLKNMHVPHYPEMSLFLTDLVLPSDSESRDGKIIVTYRPPPVSEAKESRTLEVPLQPDVEGLEQLDITLHQSPTKGYNMGSTYNDWFSECFGYPVILAYVGNNRRRVLGSMSPNLQNGGGGGWLSSIAGSIPYLGCGEKKEDEGILTFADCAAYLVVSETSVQNVSARLPDGVEMDVTKFRPNIVVSGAETAFDEDFWGELTIGDDDSSSKVKILLTSNCVRCRSIDVDYETGKHGTGEAGQVFKKLVKDRRVDKGAKWSPVFGRYGFLKDQKEVLIRVGDPVEVSKRLAERTTFDWPGLGSS